MQLSAVFVKSVASPGANAANINSIVVSLNLFGEKLGLNQPHRIAQYICQIAHESGGFKYDAEVWGKNGGTAAQKRYEDRKDLGHSAAVDGEAYMFRGRTGIQVTGRANYREFYLWCLKNDFTGPNGEPVPNFEKNPDAINTDPWEGLAPLWYWDTRELNKYADANNIEMVTKRINGGKNGFEDRLRLYSVFGLSYLGYAYTEDGIKAFQELAKTEGHYDGEIDGDDGPKTRAAIHKYLVLRGTIPVAETKAGPVTETVVAAPAKADKTGGLRLGAIISILGAPMAAFSSLDDTGKFLVVGLIIISALLMLTKGELVARKVKAIRAELEAA